MEYLIQTFGAKFCCIFASGCGGVANILTKKQFNLRALKDVALALIVGWIAAEFFITMLMEQFDFGTYTALAIAFLIGYSGIRLLPHIEEKVFKKIDKALDSIDGDKK